MSTEEWLTANRRAIEDRVAFLHALPDGVVHRRHGKLHDLLVWKTGTRIELHFDYREVTNTTKEVISDLDFARPLHLWAGFTQAMMLGLLWKPEPCRIYVLGFGGGRLPMVLHHHFPGVQVESTEVDPDVAEIASTYFGIRTDERLKVILQDGRQYLEQCGADKRFDIIMVDAFSGLGYSPFPLATEEFHQLCSRNLTDGGVLVVNLLLGDYLLHDKMRTLVDCFRDVKCVFVAKDETVGLFASHAEPRAPETIVAHAEAIQAERRFDSPFVDHARRLVGVASVPRLAEMLHRGKVLRDGQPVPPPPT
jgi:spermidine synthase